jgi:hypothetical protein
MEQGLTTETVILLVGFIGLVMVAVWHRQRLDREIAAMPQEVRERLGWDWPQRLGAKRHRRRVSSRLLLRGLPSWVPLSAAGWRRLMWFRVFGLGAGLYLIVVPSAIHGVWELILLIGVPMALILAIRGWLVGPWGE